jgi:hypothetical protein
MADHDKFHTGQHRQDISPEESAEQKDMGLTPGLTPDLHAPEISDPSLETEKNLHGDVPGSPYSPTPGEMSLGEAADKAKEAAPQAADDADTRARELESRRTGVPTETLAAEDDANDNATPPASKSKPKARK